MMGLLILSIGIYSCNKEEIKNSNNLTYKSTNNSQEENTDFSKVNWGAVVGADAAGGVVGFEMGAKVAAFTGQAWAAGVGALAGAVGSSALAAHMPCYSCPGGVSSNQPNNFRPEITSEQFKDIGFLHNEMLHKLYTTTSLINSNGQISNVNQYLDFMSTELQAMGSSTNLSGYTAILSNPEFRQKVNNYYADVYSNGFNITNTINNLEFDNQQFCTNFIFDFNANATNNIQNTISLAEQKVSEINFNGNLSLKDKNMLLVYFITYRNSATFWERFVVE